MDTNRYVSEVDVVVPALRFLGPRDRLDVFESMPPMIVSRHRSGGVVFSVGLHQGSLARLGRGVSGMRQLRHSIGAQMSWLADRHGVELFGLGATLPALTRYGQAVQPDRRPFSITTGHAGTVCLINRSLTRALHRADRPHPSIGVVGLGSIGGSVAEHLAARGVCDVLVWDRHPGPIRRLMDRVGDGSPARPAGSLSEVLGTCVATVSCVTGRLALEGRRPRGPGGGTRPTVIDDSQPAALSPSAATRAGLDLEWVVGRDTSPQRPLERTNGYRYGTDGLASPADVWGCEAEVAVLALSGHADAAVDGPITQDDVSLVDDLFDRYQITLAPSQAFGSLTDRDAASRAGGQRLRHVAR
ncbi:MAG: NAD(P)-binding domain-containing protein [Acidimicrobiales bacterium]